MDCKVSHASEFQTALPDCLPCGFRTSLANCHNCISQFLVINLFICTYPTNSLSLVDPDWYSGQLNEAEQQSLRESLKAIIHRWHRTWRGVMSNDKTSIRQMALGNCRGKIYFVPAQRGSKEPRHCGYWYLFLRKGVFHNKEHGEMGFGPKEGETAPRFYKASLYTLIGR